MSEKILFVDDEPAVLDGYRRLLHKDFAIEVAVGGKLALEKLSAAADDPYVVVVSDMRMPEMDGAQFLARVRTVYPDTVRIALTGFADIQMAMDAVNEGSIFRFLMKPCDKEILAKALTAALVQYRLVVAEKQLLEQTLSGAIHVLTEVLSLVNPAAFSRAVRIRRYVQHIVSHMRLEAGWRFEIASMMSQLGCVTLDTDTIEAVYAGRKLSVEEQTRFNAHPKVAAQLLSNIPRLEPVARMIEGQNSSLPASSSETAKPERDIVALGAQILKITLAYDQLINSGHGHQQALSALRSKPDQYERAVVDALVDVKLETRMEVRTVAIADLECDMVLQEDVRTDKGVLVVSKGQQITYPLFVRLRNFHQRKAIAGSVLVHVPQVTANVRPHAAGK